MGCLSKPTLSSHAALSSAAARLALLDLVTDLMPMAQNSMPLVLVFLESLILKKAP